MSARRIDHGGPQIVRFAMKVVAGVALQPLALRQAQHLAGPTPVNRDHVTDLGTLDETAPINLAHDTLARGPPEDELALFEQAALDRRRAPPRRRPPSPNSPGSGPSWPGSDPAHRLDYGRQDVKTVVRTGSARRRAEHEVARASLLLAKALQQCIVELTHLHPVEQALPIQ